MSHCVIYLVANIQAGCWSTTTDGRTATFACRHGGALGPLRSDGSKAGDHDVPGYPLCFVTPSGLCQQTRRFSLPAFVWTAGYVGSVRARGLRGGGGRSVEFIHTVSVQALSDLWPLALRTRLSLPGTEAQFDIALVYIEASNPPLPLRWWRQGANSMSGWMKFVWYNWRCFWENWFSGP